MHQRLTKTHDERNVVLLCEWCALDYEAERKVIAEIAAKSQKKSA